MNLNQFISFKTGHNACFSKTSSYLKTAFVLMLLCMFGTAKAQHRSHAALTYGGGSSGDSGYGIMFGVGYDAPLGVLKDAYKPTLAYNLGLTKAVNNLTFSFSLGYHSYKPREIDLGFLNDGSSDNNSVSVELSSLVFSNYKIYSAYFGAIYNVDVAEGVKVYGGANLGFYQAHYVVLDPELVIDENTDAGDIEANLLKQRDLDFYVAPRLGLTFALNENIDLSLESKYNFFAPTGHSQGGGAGTFFTSATGLVAVTFKF